MSFFAIFSINSWSFRLSFGSRTLSAVPRHCLSFHLSISICGLFCFWCRERFSSICDACKLRLTLRSLFSSYLLFFCKFLRAKNSILNWREKVSHNHLSKTENGNAHLSVQSICGDRDTRKLSRNHLVFFLFLFISAFVSHNLRRSACKRSHSFKSECVCASKGQAKWNELFKQSQRRRIRKENDELCSYRLFLNRLANRNVLKTKKCKILWNRLTRRFAIAKF